MCVAGVVRWGDDGAGVCVCGGEVDGLGSGLGGEWLGMCGVNPRPES